MALMLLPFWTDGCIGSMEGLYFEASGTTPYHFLTTSALSRAQLRPGPAAAATSDGDVDKGVRVPPDARRPVLPRLQPGDRGPGRRQPEPHAGRHSGPWHVYEVKDTELVSRSRPSRSWSRASTATTATRGSRSARAGSRTSRVGRGADGRRARRSGSGSQVTAVDGRKTDDQHLATVTPSTPDPAGAAPAGHHHRRQDERRRHLVQRRQGRGAGAGAHELLPELEGRAGPRGRTGRRRTSWSSCRPATTSRSTTATRASSWLAYFLTSSASSGWSCCGARAGRSTARRREPAPLVADAAGARRRPRAWAPPPPAEPARRLPARLGRGRASPAARRPPDGRARRTPGPRAAPAPSGDAPSAGRRRTRGPSPPPRRVGSAAAVCPPSTPSSRPTTSAAPSRTSSTRPCADAIGVASPASPARPRILIGRDMRPSGRRARRRRSATACARQGVDVVHLGLCSTDLVYFAVGPLRRARRHAHRLAQPGPVQRGQAVPGRGPAGRRGQRPGRHQGHRRAACSTAPARRPAAARGGEEHVDAARRLRRPRRVVHRHGRCSAPARSWPTRPTAWAG